MTATPEMSDGGLATIQQFWSGGDYDRLASYGSAAEAVRLVRSAGLKPGEDLLDVGTGSGIVAVVAAQRGARVTGVDPTPALLVRAAENAALAGVEVDWREGLAEGLPFPDASFDVVLSQYAHMFSAVPERAADEMLRVLKPGGRLAFAAWTPDGLAPLLMGLTMTHLPPTPGPAPPSPFAWGSPPGVLGYLGTRVKDVRFEHHALMFPALSPGHMRKIMEETFAPAVTLIRALADRQDVLSEWRRTHDQMAGDFFADGCIRFEYLLSRATKQ